MRVYTRKSTLFALNLYISCIIVYVHLNLDLQNAFTGVILITIKCRIYENYEFNFSNINSAHELNKEFRS